MGLHELLPEGWFLSGQLQEKVVLFVSQGPRAVFATAQQRRDCSLERGLMPAIAATRLGLAAAEVPRQVCAPCWTRGKPVHSLVIRVTDAAIDWNGASVAGRVSCVGRAL